MKSILIVSSLKATFKMISTLIKSESFNKISSAISITQASKFMLETEYDLIIIDSPLQDGDGDILALAASEKTTAGIILLVEADKLDLVSQKVEDEGVFVLPKPVSPEFFFQAIKLFTACRRRVLNLEYKNQKLQKKIDEIKIVDRAKLILIQVLNMTELQAHKYIEKQAMDLRQSRLTTAENILKTYER